jgi:iron complex outermembrane receptor protein
MITLKKLPTAIKFAMFVGAASLASGNAFAQDQAEEEQEAKTLDRIEVTGSRVKRADIEGALPVTVIDRATIDASGDVSVADILRDTTFASFGNFRPQSGSSAQALADIDLRGLGSNRTLVLVDGRRAPKAPFAGSTQDLNSIPVAAVERIEILSDGASAVYGSDAIGGVVNIVLRKDFEGAELRYGIGNTKVTGGDTREGAVLFGTSGDRGRLIAGASVNERGMVFTRDQIGGDSLGVSTFGNNYRLESATTGRPTGAFIPFDGYACDDENFYFTNPGGPGNICSFNFNAVAANEASIKTKSLFARGDFQINDNWTTYMTASVAKVESFGRYAATPGEVYVPEGSPNDPRPGDGLGVFVRHRFAAAGNRDNDTDADVTDLLIGMQGRIFDKIDLDFGLRRNHYNYDEFGSGYIVRPLAEQYIADGSYDLRDPFGNPPEVLNAIQAVITRQSEWKTEELFAIANFDVFEMGGGMSNMAVGAEYRTEDYADLYDSLQEAGVIEGSSGNSAQGGRDVYSAFLEWLFPITSTFEVTFAGRYDRYSDYGSDFSPKIAARWQPLENLTLRGSYGQGFRAPTLDILTQQPAFSADPVTDLQTCLSFGRTDCATNPQIQIDATVIANSQLSSEQSDQYSFGVAYDPMDWLNVTLDYYNIKIEERIVSFSSQTLINRSINPALGPIPPGLGVQRDPVTGGIIRVIRGSGNEGDLETNGVDLNLRTRFDMGDMGRLQNHLAIAYVNKYEIDGSDVGLGTVGIPQMRANLANTWSVGDFSFNLINRYIEGQDGVEDVFDPVGGYTTHDASVNWKAPWNGQVTVGVNNLGDKYPALVGYDGRPWNFYLYDAYGRTVYFRYTQQF